jgi:hypothetical protein
VLQKRDRALAYAVDSGVDVVGVGGDSTSDDAGVDVTFTPMAALNAAPDPEMKSEEPGRSGPVGSKYGWRVTVAIEPPRRL